MWCPASVGSGICLSRTALRIQCQIRLEVDRMASQRRPWNPLPDMANDDCPGAQCKNRESYSLTSVSSPFSPHGQGAWNPARQARQEVCLKNDDTTPSQSVPRPDPRS